MTRRVVVTGAGQGIGRAIALRFLREGAQVHGLDRNEEALQEVAASGAAAGGGRFVAHRVDLADRDATDRTAEELIDAMKGSCDTLVNNAGISMLRPFADYDDVTVDTLFAVNIFAAFRLTRRLMPVIQGSAHGSIVNIASELALIGQAGYAAYCA